MKNKKNVTWTGIVNSYPDFRRHGGTLILSVTEAVYEGQSYPVAGKISLFLKRITRNWFPGIVVTTHFSVTDFRNFKNPGSFDYKGYMMRKGILGRAYLTSDRMIFVRKYPHGLWKKAVSHFRRKSFDFLMENLPKPENSIYIALLLGIRKLIPAYVWEAFNVAGVTHLLAISGLHLGLLLGIFFFVFSYLFGFWEWGVLRFGKNRIALVFTIPFLFFYGILTGMALPTLRATLMLIFTAVAILASRTRDLWQILALAALVILVNQSRALFSASFQLSFAALISILYALPRLEYLINQHGWTKFSVATPNCKNNGVSSSKHKVCIFTVNWQPSNFVRKMGKRAIEAVLVSLVATMGVLPLLAYHFHIAPIMGIFANVVTIPLIGFIALPIGLFSIAIAYFIPSLAQIIIWPGTKALHLALMIVLRLSEISWGAFMVPAMGVVSIFLFYAGFYLALSRLKLKYKIPVLVITTILFVGSFNHPRPVPGSVWPSTTINPRGKMDFTVLDAGHGNVFFIRFPDNKIMVIDGGSSYWGTFDTGKYVVAPFLWENNLKTIDYLVLASSRPGNMTLPFLVKSFSIKEFWQSGVGLRGSAFKYIFKRLASRKIYKPPLEDLRYRKFGDVECFLVHPKTHDVHWVDDKEEYTHLSMAFLFTYRHTRTIVVPKSWIPEKEEWSFLEKQNRKKTFLLLYGKEPITQQIINRITRLHPQLIVNSPGGSGKRKKDMERIGSFLKEVTYFSPERDGAIRVVSDGEKLFVDTFNSRRK